MQHLANVTSLRPERPGPRSRSRAVNHIYAGATDRVPALDDISLSVGAGKFTVIVGPSGCGKTRC